MINCNHVGGNIDMIKKFSVKNYKGFKDELVMDFTSRDYAFSSELIKNNLVNKAMVYGKNGSGKSNLGYALFDITAHLTDKEVIPPRYIKNYANLDSGKKIVEFSYVFQFGDKEIIYYYEKLGINTLIYEELHINGEIKIIANHIKNEVQIDGIAGTENLNMDMRGNLSIIKYIARNTNQSENSPISQMMKFVDNMLWFRRLDDGNSYAGYRTGGDGLGAILKKKDKVKDFEEFLRENSVNYNLRVNDEDLIMAKYKNGIAQFEDVASSGTQALWLFYCWLLEFDNISFLFIDEFDAFYHYETAEYIVNLLNRFDKFQSVVTTHNTALLCNELTRPDCAYILANGKVNALCACTDKEIREAHNLEKMYRNGAFTNV